MIWIYVLLELNHGTRSTDYSFSLICLLLKHRVLSLGL